MRTLANERTLTITTGTTRSTHESLNVYSGSKSLSPALSIDFPSKSEMTFKLVHLERRWLNNALVLNYIKVRSVHPAAWGFY